jgi:hypothetical protein
MRLSSTTQTHIVYSGRPSSSKANANINSHNNMNTNTNANANLNNNPHNNLNTNINPHFSPSKVAALIETRTTPNLAPLLLHFTSLLGPTWPLKIFTTPSLIANLSLSAPISRLLASNTLTFIPLPPGATFSTHAAVSAFLTTPWFWEKLGPAEKVLMFQADSMLCANSERRVDDFLGWDFVGAPVRAGLGEGYNGGLSLRNVALSLAIVRAESWERDRKENKGGGGPNVDYEDQWFFAKMRERGARLPGVEVAGQFAVETVWRERPLGYHQAQVWQKRKMGRVLEWCPEYRLCTNETFTSH